MAPVVRTNTTQSFTGRVENGAWPSRPAPAKFPGIGLLAEQRRGSGDDKQTMHKNLCVSFSDDDQINEINKDQTFKINTRSVLGVKNNNDWIYGLNIGNIMHLTPFMFDEVYDDIS